MNGFLLLLILLPIQVAQGNKEISCAVMPINKVDISSATKHKRYADYKDRRYFFCCGACPTAFKKNPDKFAKNSSTPIPSGSAPG